MHVTNTSPSPGAQCCERCGSAGFLARNRDLAPSPAWCISCHERADTTQARAGHPCEDGCALTTDHDGLCAVRA
ncbi:hypothetical protein GCM10010211_20370 [Streptomyces albospinus]|uniref:Uncharacterized protein n=1 Tax=Streptomyces albospinus TaxID=285515 RepID=A0ABQ2UXB5_9ACTN|nr:hypothetical protein [Streptomyces albospinus]GGU55538.1 hypothetical protein GCM10010211_20370 [Streptomyces albospinus]